MRMTITNQEIADLMTTAVEGGCTYWCNQLRPDVYEYPGKSGPWYADPAFYDRDFAITVVDHEDEVATYVLTSERVQEGYLEWQTNYPKHWADFKSDDYDADTADTFLQTLAFGEVVYG